MAHWIIDNHGFEGAYCHCSNCGEGYNDLFNKVEDFCPHCKVVMDEEAEYIEDKPMSKLKKRAAIKTCTNCKHTTLGDTTCLHCCRNKADLYELEN